MSPLDPSEYTISNTKTFLKQIRKEKLILRYEMIPFDATPLFTKFIAATIEIILKRVYEKKEITTTIPKRGIKEFLYFCEEVFICLLIMRCIYRMMS